MRKVSSILIALAALAQGGGALEAGNKPITTAFITWLLLSSGLASQADPGEAAAASTAEVGQPLTRNGTGPVPVPRVAPKVEATAAQRAAAPDSVTRAFTAALEKYQETTYLAHLFANPDGTPIRAGQVIPPLEETSEQTPETLPDPLRKAPWTSTLERVAALDRAVMDGLSEVLQATTGKRLASLEKPLETIKARSLELQAELRTAAQDFYQARAAFKESHPGQDLRSVLRESPPQDPLADREPRDPEFALQVEALRFHSQRVEFMGKALQRYLDAFLAATAELLPERKPFPDEDERTPGNKAPGKAAAGLRKAPQGQGKVFVTRPADGRFSMREEL